MGESPMIDDKVVASTLQSIRKNLEGVAGITSLMGRRKPTFTYRGVKIALPVQSLEHQYETAVAVRLRQEAVLAKQLVQLPAEADLCQTPTTSSWRIAESQILGAKKARKLLWEKVNEQRAPEKKDKKEKKEKDGNAVEAFVLNGIADGNINRRTFCKQLVTYESGAACRLFQKPLAKADAHWAIDAALVKVFCSGDAAAMVKSSWLDRVSAATDIDKAVKESSAMMAREAYKYSLPSVKGEIKTAHTYLVNLKKQECLMESPRCTAWCTRVLKSLEHHYLVKSLATQYKIKVLEPVDLEKPGQGRMVMDSVLEALRKSGGPSDLKQLLPLSVWRHLLSTEEKAELIKWREAALKKSKDAMTSAPSKQKEEKKRPKKESTSQADVEAAALALFRK
eukprot:527706-Amphidinium_carterae.3